MQTHTNLSKLQLLQLFTNLKARFLSPMPTKVGQQIN